MQRPAGLCQREVKRRAVKRPAAVEAGNVCLGLYGEQVERVDQLAELDEREASREVVDGTRLLQCQLVLVLVDDVLADALDAAAVEVDDRRQSLEAARDLRLQALQGVAVDLERKVG